VWVGVKKYGNLGDGLKAYPPEEAFASITFSQPQKLLHV
jgi:hypothetical protein